MPAVYATYLKWGNLVKFPGLINSHLLLMTFVITPITESHCHYHFSVCLIEVVVLNQSYILESVALSRKGHKAESQTWGLVHN